MRKEQREREKAQHRKPKVEADRMLDEKECKEFCEWMYKNHKGVLQTYWYQWEKKELVE